MAQLPTERVELGEMNFGQLDEDRLASDEGSSVYVINFAPLVLFLVFDAKPTWGLFSSSESAVKWAKGIELAKSCAPEVKSTEWDISYVGKQGDRPVHLMKPSDPMKEISYLMRRPVRNRL